MRSTAAGDDGPTLYARATALESRSDPRLCIRWSPAIRALNVAGAVLIAVLGAALAAVMTTLLVDALRSGHPSAGLAWALLDAVWLLLIAAMVAVAIRKSRMTLVTDERGLTVRDLARSAAIPWAEYRGAESVEQWRWRGAMRVRSEHRPPIVARITAAKYSLLRSDELAPPTHPLPHPADRGHSPLLVALAAAHQFWRRRPHTSE